MYEQPLVIAILFGIVTGGAVWFAWGLVENIIHTVSKKRTPKQDVTELNGS